MLPWKGHTCHSYAPPVVSLEQSQNSKPGHRPPAHQPVIVSSESTGAMFPGLCRHLGSQMDTAHGQRTVCRSLPNGNAQKNRSRPVGLAEVPDHEQGRLHVQGSPEAPAGFWSGPRVCRRMPFCPAAQLPSIPCHLLRVQPGTPCQILEQPRLQHTDTMRLGNTTNVVQNTLDMHQPRARFSGSRSTSRAPRMLSCSKPSSRLVFWPVFCSTGRAHAKAPENLEMTDASSDCALLTHRPAAQYT